jgi:hypothetical protein
MTHQTEIKIASDAINELLERLDQDETLDVDAELIAETVVAALAKEKRLADSSPG